jgi:ABC-2 type transport system permease protein
MLTFVYLYNFRSLQGSPEDVSEIYKWWHAVLALANVAFGACVVAAIATRFIFPSISLEGRAYALVRAAPLSIEKLLEHKFRIWFFPTAALSLLLLVSGTWAIYSAPETIAATAILAIALSIGIVGLGVGIGAVYAKFDWDSPAQVTASFGSLVYMLLALALIMLTLVLASMMFVLTTVPSFAVSMSDDEYLLALACSFFLVFFVNYQAAHHAMNAGAERLKDLER